MSLSDAGTILLTLSFFGTYIAWLAVFFVKVDPRIRQWIGGWLGVYVEEDIEGLWEIVGPHNWLVGCGVFILQLVICVLAVIGPFCCGILLVIFWLFDL